MITYGLASIRGLVVLTHGNIWARIATYGYNWLPLISPSYLHYIWQHIVT